MVGAAAMWGKVVERRGRAAGSKAAARVVPPWLSILQ